MIEPIERKDTLSDQAYEQLRAALMAGVFKPGESLSIRRLASLLEISVTPARDAISRVLWEGGLDAGPNRTVLVPELTLEKLREIYAVRLNLEGTAAALSIRNLDDKVLAELTKLYESHKSAVASGEYSAALKANEAFHFGIYKLSKNSLLIEIIRSLWLKLGPSLNLLYPAYFNNLKGVSNHSRVMDALKEFDPIATRSAIEADLYDGQDELARALSKHEENSSTTLGAK